jgi:hypothetical protein
MSAVDVLVIPNVVFSFRYAVAALPAIRSRRIANVFVKLVCLKWHLCGACRRYLTVRLTGGDAQDVAVALVCPWPSYSF